MSRFPEIAAAAALVLAVWQGAAVAQDTAAGEKVFAKCKACHAVGEGAKNKVGPELNGIVGRAAGSLPDYKYSKAMEGKGAEGLIWDEASLAAYLADPRGFVKGTKMAFAGLKKPEDLENIIAYLATFAADGSKAAEAPAAAPEQEAKTQAQATSEKAPAAEAPSPSPVAKEAGEGHAPAEAAMAAPTGGAPESEGGLKLGLGRVATGEEIAAWDIDVRPDGLGLPEGSGTASQGMAIYDENCASCHGDFGEAIGRWPVLAGGQGTLQNDRPEKTIGSYWPYLSTVYDYVKRAMPFGNARSLSDDDVYALTAYLLYLNDIVDDEQFELSKENFSSIHLPNEQNFVDDDRAQEPHYAAKAEPCMSDCKPGKAEITMHAAVLDVTPENSENDDAPAGGID